MFFSIGIILLFGLFINLCFKNLGLPLLIWMIPFGILIGPYTLNLLSSNFLELSPYIRKAALIIILLRAGLSLDIESIKANSITVLKICFIPATIEILSVTVLGHFIFKIGFLESAIMGTVLAAVSPAVVVPRMLSLKDKGYKKIPDLIMLGASIDDIYVIVMFTSLLGIYSGGSAGGLMAFLNVPLSIITGIALGVIISKIQNAIFMLLPKTTSISVKVMSTFGICLIIVGAEELVNAYIPVAMLVSVITMGVMLKRDIPGTAKELSVEYNRMWIFAELFLFVLVGVQVNPNSLVHGAFSALLLIVIALVLRVLTVIFILDKKEFSNKEKLFFGISYSPKATVQAAIGSIPLVSGVESGELILTVAVVSILFTAPVGAILIDKTYNKLLPSPTES